LEELEPVIIEIELDDSTDSKDGSDWWPDSNEIEPLPPDTLDPPDSNNDPPDTPASPDNDDPPDTDTDPPDDDPDRPSPPRSINDPPEPVPPKDEPPAMLREEA
jgi:hypothetical protein